MIYQIFFILYFLYITIILPIVILPLALIQKILLPNHIDSWGYISKCSLNLLCLKQQYASRAKLIDKGYILANHRCFLDFSLDPVYTRSTVIGRYKPFLCMPILSFLGILDNRIIAFKRGETGKDKIMSKINKHFNKKGLFSQRILFYPEGTRKKYETLESPEDFKNNHLKFGLLKAIYEDKKYPVQIFMSSNKEKVIDEKKLKLSLNQTIISKICEPIYPDNFETFDDFINNICNIWYESYNEIHKIN
jgi:hypothetical protein